MNKRHFLESCTATAALMMTRQSWAAVRDIRLIKEAGAHFQWSHDDGWLNCVYSAPTAGWLAVGFNARHQLKGTRFVIAAVSEKPLRLEERIAIVPEHMPVQQFGLAEAVSRPTGVFKNGRSELGFSLPERVQGRPDLDLGRGAKVHLMLAWSHHTDFQHHSAWRKHFAIHL